MTDRSELDWQIRQALRRHAVREHYKESAARGRRVYALFSDAKQASEPCSHKECHQQREDRTVADLLQLIGGPA